MTKEKILQYCITDPLTGGQGLTWDNCINAMEQYAKQEAIGFYVWNAKTIAQYLDDIKTLRGEEGAAKVNAIAEFESATIEQRYLLYRQHIERQSKNKQP